MPALACRTSCLLLPLAILAGLAFAPDEPQTSAAAAKPSVAVTISKETTRITEPLREDGYPDYLAALNQIASKGVTPENNAPVPFWQAMGPRPLNPEVRERFVAMLGIAPLSEEGQYYVSLAEHVRKAAPTESRTDEVAAELWEVLDEAMGRPWTEEELPLVASWLKANEKPIELFVEASLRPRRYDPLLTVGDDGLLIEALLPGAQESREAARALAARAMLRLGSGQVDAAWGDLLAVHRLGRLANQGPTLIDALVGIAIDAIACRGDNVLIAHGRLTSRQALGMRDELREIPLCRTMTAKMDVAERLMYLDSVTAIARGGLDRLDRIAGSGESRGAASTILGWAGRVAIDWDVPLQMGNPWYDRLVAAGQKSAYAERKAAMNQIETELKETAAKVRDVKSLAYEMLGGPRRVLSERLGQIFVSLLLPAVGAALEAEERGLIQRQLSEMGFSLAAYRADHGKYPSRLADLLPKYAEAIPEDVFSGADLIYRSDSGSILLYSVGRNGQDDGGRGYNDRDETPGSQDWDDLLVRVPLKPKGKQ